MHLREELPWRHDPERQPRAPIHPASEVRYVARHEVGGVGDDRRREEGRSFEDKSGGVSRSTSPGAGSLAT